MTETVERMLPLYEAKMIHQFDHRWATYENSTTRELTRSEKSDANQATQPRYWVDAGEVRDTLDEKWNRPWLFGWRDITRATDARTAICSPFGPVAAPDGTLLMLPHDGAEDALILSAILSAFAFDFTVRQKVGGTHLKFFTMRQLPVISPEQLSTAPTWTGLRPLHEWIASRSFELTYTAWDMQSFAEDLGDTGAPFVWDPERRFLLRAELDAAFFHLYGVSREDADYILDTFPIVRRKDEEAHGEYRTKRVVLEIFDAMQHAADTGTAYDPILTPEPGKGLRHPMRESSDRAEA
ncbi:hypothetical protein [Rhodococcus daqingensis]|uniref:Uncharacterized protein n=1 Tax=Rhodococcus daqingensis TaxID=2479363 RepID=A0ABW2S0S2_9NOCA